MRRSTLTACVIFALIAGCSEPDSGGGGHLQTPSTTATQGPATNSDGPVLDPPSFLTLRIDATNCNGFGMAVEVPAALYNVARPTGWPSAAEQIPTANAMDLYYQVFECERLSWDGFERGPVWFMLERHGDFVAPDSCGRGDFTIAGILQSVWFSDPDLVAHAVASYNLPAARADFSSSIDVAVAVVQQTWTFGLPGRTAATVTQPWVEDNFIGHGTTIFRSFWVDGEGVGLLDITQDENTPQAGPDNAWGRLEAPLLYGSTMPDSSFTSDRSDLLTDVPVSAPIQRFKDAQCQQSV